MSKQASYTPTEAAVLADISIDEMWRHLEVLCRIDRTSGTQGEFEAVEYLAQVLREYGLEPVIHRFEAYLSYPRGASLRVTAAPPGVALPEPVAVKTRSFSASTPPGGVEGELVYVPGGRDMFRDTETRRRLEGLDLHGKVVLSEGGGRQNMITARRRGAVAYVHMWPSDEEAVHEGIVTPVWGTPTPETAGLIPDIPVVQVNRAAGLALKDALDRGPVRVRVETAVETGWRPQRMLEVHVPGRMPEYVLAAGHIDSWHLGATDNATGNVACLELARVFARHRRELRRGLKIVWWTGHSTGRYAGSTWYADRFWQDLYDHCVLYINIDSPGSLGATDYSLITAMAETARVGAEVVELVTGQRPGWERPVRAGDQSFWGIGVPSLFMLLSNRPEGQRWQVGGSGMGWWWHTEADTIDKVDRNVLLTDTRIHALAALRFCTAARLPLDVDRTVDELAAVVADLSARAGGHFDFGPVQDGLAELRQALAALARLDDDAHNRAVIGALRALIPINYTAAGPFDHDLAVPAVPLPALARAAELPSLAGDRDAYGFLQARLVRERNRVVFALRAARDAVLREVRA